MRPRKYARAADCVLRIMFFMLSLVCVYVGVFITSSPLSSAMLAKGPIFEPFLILDGMLIIGGVIWPKR